MRDDDREERHRERGEGQDDRKSPERPRRIAGSGQAVRLGQDDLGPGQQDHGRRQALDPGIQRCDDRLEQVAEIEDHVVPIEPDGAAGGGAANEGLMDCRDQVGPSRLGARVVQPGTNQRLQAVDELGVAGGHTRANERPDEEAGAAVRLEEGRQELLGQSFGKRLLGRRRLERPGHRGAEGGPVEDRPTCPDGGVRERDEGHEGDEEEQGQEAAEHRGSVGVARRQTWETPPGKRLRIDALLQLLHRRPSARPDLASGLRSGTGGGGWPRNADDLVTMLDRLVLVGAMGDLARRHLLPGVSGLVAAGRVPDPFRVLGIGRGEVSASDFREFVRKSVVAAHRQDATGGADRLAGGASYLRWDPSDGSIPGPAIRAAPALIYLAIPPWAFEPAIEGIARAGVPSGTSILVEKPFGTDATSATRLNASLARAFDEAHVFRADHVFHHDGIRRLVDLRFAGGDIEQWSRDHIERVDITWFESGSPAGREEYYDRSGALLDMIQSHLLALLSVVVMDRPTDPGPDAVRAARVAALRAVATPTADDVAARTRRAVYEDGRVDGAPVAGYRRLAGVDPDRRTETFAAVEVRVENERWAGVPFTLASGKAIGSNRRSIDIRFRPGTPHAPGRDGPAARGWTLRIPMPAGPRQVNRHDGRGWHALENVPAREDRSLTTSGRMVLDALRGEQAWFLREDEPLEGWRIVEPIVDGWRSDVVPLRSYPAGSDPSETLLSATG